MRRTGIAEPSERRKVYKLLYGFFEGDAQKARTWMRTPNPLLGGVRPTDLLALRPGKLLKFVEHALSENVR